MFSNNGDFIFDIDLENTKWKSGFYILALKAGVPLGMGDIDYPGKVAGAHAFGSL